MTEANLYPYVEQYELEVTDQKVWTPYALEETGVQKPVLRGKGSGDELQTEADRIFGEYVGPLDTPEHIRYVMLRNHFGVDCSGFAYHTLREYLSDVRGIELADNLVMSREQLLDWKGKFELVKKVGGKMLDFADVGAHIPLSTVTHLFRRKPEWLTDVKRLTDPAVSSTVEQAGRVLPGDLIAMHGQWGDHVMVVYALSKGEIHAASSDFDPTGPGGVTLHQIQMALPVRGITEQLWWDFDVSRFDEVQVVRHSLLEELAA